VAALSFPGQKFVEPDGGTVELQSAADAGTKVICTLPHKASA